MAAKRRIILTAEEVAEVARLQGRDEPGFIAGYMEWQRKGPLSFCGINTLETALLYDTNAVACALGAPTGSGKGTSFFIPMLLGGWNSSSIVHDPKRENAVVCSGFRKHVLGHKQLFLEPLDKSGYSARWNSLDEVRFGDPEEVQDAKEQAAIFIDPKAKRLEGGSDAHWLTAGIGATVAATIFVAYDNKDASRSPTWADVRNLFTDPRFADLKQLAQWVMTQDHAQGRSFYWTRDKDGNEVKQHPEIVRGFTRLMNGSANEVESVRATLLTQLEMFADPIIVKNTSVSDFSVSDLMNGDVPIDLWLISPPSKIALIAPLFGALLATFLSRTTESMGYKDGRAVMPHKRKLLMCIDELPQLPKLDQLVKGIAVFRAYGVRLAYAYQSFSQLEGTYGKFDANTLLDNSDLQLIQTPNSHGSAKEISEALGNWTAVVDNVSESGDKSMFAGMKSVSLSDASKAVALMNPQQVRQMPQDRQIVMRKGLPPVYAKKAFYYEHKFWDKWAKIPWPGKSDVIRRVKFSLNYSRFAPGAAGSLADSLTERGQDAIKGVNSITNETNLLAAESAQDVDTSRLPTYYAAAPVDTDNDDSFEERLDVADEGLIDDLTAMHETNERERAVREGAIDPSTGEVLPAGDEPWAQEQASSSDVPLNERRRGTRTRVFDAPKPVPGHTDTSGDNFEAVAPPAAPDETPAVATPSDDFADYLGN